MTNVLTVNYCCWKAWTPFAWTVSCVNLQPCVNQMAKKKNLDLYIYLKVTQKEQWALKQTSDLDTRPYHVLPVQWDILISFYYLKLNVIRKFFPPFLSLTFPRYIYLPFLGYTIMLNCAHNKYSSELNMSSKNINMKGFCLHTKHTAQLLWQLLICFQFTAGNYWIIITPIRISVGFCGLYTQISFISFTQDKMSKRREEQDNSWFYSVKKK